jgi:peptidyl-prolyl cis-trans isomerase SurA
MTTNHQNPMGGGLGHSNTERRRLRFPVGHILLFFNLFLISGLLMAVGTQTAFAVPDSQSQVIDRVLAVVNGEVITLSELNEAKARFRLHLEIPDPIRMNSTDSDPVPGDRELLNRLIEQKLQLQLARKNGIQAETSEVDGLLEEIRRNGRYYTEGDLREALRKEQISVDRYRKNIENDIVILKLANREIKSGIFIDQEELKSYYEKNSDRFRLPDKVRLRQILLLVPSPDREQEIQEKAGEFAARIRNGADFQSLAETYSQGPNAKDGGELGFLETAHLLPAVTQALKGVEAGGVTGPVRTTAGVQIFQVEEISAGQVQPFESVEDAIRDALYQEKAARRYEEWVQNLWNSGQVEVKF